MNTQAKHITDTEATPVEQPTQDAPAADTGHWSDPKRYLWLLSPALPGIGLAALAGYAIAPKKLKALAWTGPALIHGIVPALDRLVGEDQSNPPEDAVANLLQDKYYDRVVKAFIPSQWALTMLGAWLASRKNVPLEDRLGITLTVGGINGLGINTGHELGHKSSKLNKIAAMAALAPSAYTHFVVEHNFGHHKHVATFEDPASSRMGESFWKFLPRTVVGGFKSAIKIETARLKRKNKTFWSTDNELLQGWAMTAGLFGATTLVCGPRALPFLAAQAAYGASLLETVNYMEHYGLLRETDANGKPVRTRPEHSWNSNHIITNLVLYQLQRHSDHHAHPTRAFQALRHFEGAPQLPGGYASLILPAYIPGKWFDTMDKRVIDHYKGDLSKINWDPERKEELMAKYAAYAAEVAAKAQAEAGDQEEQRLAS